MAEPLAEQYIGIDIGGTSTRLGLFSSLAVSPYTPIARFPTQQSYQQQLQAIFDALQAAHVTHLVGIGVSIAGKIAKDGQSVIVAPNLPGYIGQPFSQDIARRAGCLVRLAHDTVCGLLAEKKFGHISTIDRCAYLTLSTGTGAAFQLRKETTVLTVSIEIGHQILDGNELACLCGQVGCLETFTGGRQLELRYGHSLAQKSDTAFWETFCEKLAIGLVNLAQLTKVEAIAVSGAIVLNHPFLLPLLQQRINTMIRGTSIALSEAVLGEHAPIVGAALLLETPESTILH